MTEMLVNRMQWKSKHKNMVKYQGVMRLLYKKQRRETGVKGQRDRQSTHYTYKVTTPPSKVQLT